MAKFITTEQYIKVASTMGSVEQLTNNITNDTPTDMILDIVRDNGSCEFVEGIACGILHTLRQLTQ